MAISAVPILPVQTLSGNQWRAVRLIEETSSTFLLGTPVSIASGDGGIQAWDGSTGVNGTIAQGAICGISYEAASNLSATGSGAPSPLSPLTGVGAVLGTTKNVQNESSAVTIFHGAPINDGRVGLFVASTDTVFSAMFGNNGATATPAATDVGKFYGLTIDSSSKYWYVDKNKSTQGTNTCVKIVSLDLRVAAGAGTLVFFQFDPRYVNLIG